MKWYGEQVEGKFNIASLAGLEAAAITLEKAVVDKIYDKDIIDTGRYVGSITFRAYGGKQSKVKPDKKGITHQEDAIITIPKADQAIVGTNLHYAPYLEYGAAGRPPRPAIRQAYDEMKASGKCQDVYEKQFRKMFK